MIKNKGLYIKIIFKIYLKILKINYKYFRLSNRHLFYKSWDNNFQKLFYKIIFQNYFRFRNKSITSQKKIQTKRKFVNNSTI